MFTDFASFLICSISKVSGKVPLFGLNKINNYMQTLLCSLIVIFVPPHSSPQAVRMIDVSKCALLILSLYSQFNLEALDFLTLKVETCPVYSVP